ncbi:DUF1499 domain-containing protein [Thiohalobacter thiocyanaticus]|uniref:DUF1499 domain-containing protein n=1 Tax=Thiohalobacter thiocyanaticus TaxID=585455 RepID=A0A426QIG3_9GAMM|nr:DUF1499 domain-containing protein [Thiohalobacter thiocyanaticus]RRQ21543.1 DUF1499 domain-containing protein [Thiohalobacter thiocyanaticus]
MKAALLVLSALVLLAIAALFVLAIHSRSLAPPERADVRLPSCPASPNCVSSEYPDDAAHYIEPLELPQDMPADAALNQLGAQVRELGGEVKGMEDDYLAAIFRSRILGFVDDLQLRLDTQERLVHVRSASRVGRGDLGANRSRVEALRRHWQRTVMNELVNNQNVTGK